MQLAEELRNLSYRELQVSLQDLLPRADASRLKREFERFVKSDPHETVFGIARELWHGGYERVLEDAGFYEERFAKFSGHAQQCSVVLGAILHSLGFQVAYLECFRIHEGPFLRDGHIVRVGPEEEHGALREEFMEIGRIPYCLLEVTIDDVPYYVSAKHLRPHGTSALALLTPTCYRPFVGVFRHQDDHNRSGIYIKSVLPHEHITTVFGRRVVWLKQTPRDPEPEMFATFLRMDLIDAP